jgi:hypothetical protein
MGSSYGADGRATYGVSSRATALRFRTSWPHSQARYTVGAPTDVVAREAGRAAVRKFGEALRRLGE